MYYIVGFHLSILKHFSKEAKYCTVWSYQDTESWCNLLKGRQPANVTNGNISDISLIFPAMCHAQVFLLHHTSIHVVQFGYIVLLYTFIYFSRIKMPGRYQLLEMYDISNVLAIILAKILAKCHLD